MAYDETLAERVRALLADHPAFSERKMFGGIGFMLAGHMACGVSGDGLMARVGPDAYEAAVMRPHARPFDMTGRPMRGWVMVDAAGIAADADLAAWVEEGAAFALSLPPK